MRSNCTENGHQNPPHSLLSKTSLFRIHWYEPHGCFRFAEDWVCMGEPDLATFLMIHEQRKDYFWETQKKVPSSRVLDPSSLPAKNESLHGIVWLPRIIQKARAKLLGELDPTTMYCCGGDRYFFQTNQIHPAEFLRVVKRAGNDDSSIVQWVLNRKNETE